MVAPGIDQTMRDLHETNQVIGSLMVTIYLLGFSIGPLFLGPFSEMYGRYPVVILSTWFFNAWILGSALAPTMPALIMMRLLGGLGGSAVMTIAPAICADMYPIERRAFSTSLITLAQSFGPALGPLCGSFISEDLGWRWDYWILLMATGTVTTLMTIFMPESYAPILLQHKAGRLRKQTGRDDLQPMLSLKMTRKQLLLTSIVRPTKVCTKDFSFLLVKKLATNSSQAFDTIANRLSHLRIRSDHLRVSVLVIHNNTYCFRRSVRLAKSTDRTRLHRLRPWNDNIAPYNHEDERRYSRQTHKEK